MSWFHLRFCGRIPKTRVWKTTFSEINIEYKKGKGLRGRGRQVANPGPHSGSREDTATSSSRSQAARDRAERLKRIKALHELYKLKTRQNMLSQRHKKQEQQSDSSRYYHHSRNRELSGSRRFYRHANHSTQIGNKDLMLDGNRFVYDLESNTYSIATAHRHTIGVRLLGVGEPAWFNSNFVLHGRENNTDPHLEYYLEDFELERELDSETRHNTSKGRSNQDYRNLIMQSGDESVERYRRSPRVSQDQLTSQQHTVTHRSRTPYRQQRLSLKDHRRHHHNPSASSASRRALHSSDSRGRNEIIPNKLAKPTQRGWSHELKKFTYENSKISSGTHKRRGHSNRLGGGSRRKKGEYFVLKVES